MENNPIPKEEQDTLEKWSAYREAAREEYEYAHSNANRLDNKVYILLAACAFLFPLVYPVRIEAAGIMSSWPEGVLKVIRLLPMGCLSAAIVILLYAFKTTNIARVDVYNTLVKAKARNESALEVEKRFAWLYAISRVDGKAREDRRHKITDIALMLIIASVVILLTTEVIQRYYPDINRGGEVSMNMDRRTEISSDEAANMTADELIDYAVKNGVMLRTPTTRELMSSKYFHYRGVNRKD
ncbi:MAG: hypothetical protein IJG51_05130 [Synergistaceae bacterium]|nr:hypothetical protein [Synergistaceae bacterium]MBQ3347413.1 hypothetical protein [Synergistaceae bacterium]MBQ3398248.1 hypothetical protein [Synergistaceae bacterium]MBR0184727.1 hypothetical protein [Synergistaceae bacterium]MBR0248876.1 hypothetical protein [Synergistaceae bacterium]